VKNVAQGGNVEEIKELKVKKQVNDHLGAVETVDFSLFL
jgi:hypothetical protein